MYDFSAGLLGSTGTQSEALGSLGVPLNSSVSKTANYTVVLADRGKVIKCNGTFTVSLPGVATLGDGFVFGIANDGSGAITLDPNLSELVDAQPTKVISTGQNLLFYCDGTKISTFSGSGSGKGWITRTISTSGTWTKPAGCSALDVFLIGASGGGGCYPTDYSFGAAGGGGGVCAIAISNPSSSYSYVLSAGGSPSTAGNAGGSAGTSTFGGLLTANGGSGGSSAGAGGAGGTASGGSVNASGTSGGAAGGAAPGAGASPAIVIDASRSAPTPSVGAGTSYGGSGGLASFGGGAGSSARLFIVEWY
jgi:hypothetical protein